MAQSEETIGDAGEVWTDNGTVPLFNVIVEVKDA